MKHHATTPRKTKKYRKNRNHKDDWEDCFIQEEYNPYPLCIGRKLKKCKECQLHKNWEPEDPYDIE